MDHGQTMRLMNQVQSVVRELQSIQSTYAKLVGSDDPLSLSLFLHSAGLEDPGIPEITRMLQKQLEGLKMYALNNNQNMWKSVPEEYFNYDFYQVRTPKKEGLLSNIEPLFEYLSFFDIYQSCKAFLALDTGDLHHNCVDQITRNYRSDITKMIPRDILHSFDYNFHMDKYHPAKRHNLESPLLDKGMSMEDIAYEIICTRIMKNFIHAMLMYMDE